MLYSQFRREEDQEIRDERDEQSDVFVVDDGVNEEREHGEWQILHELQTDEAFDVQHDLEFVMPLEQLCNQARRGHARHQCTQNQCEAEILAEEENPFRYRRRIDLITDSGITFAPDELACEIHDQQRYHYAEIGGLRQRRS